MSSGINPPPTSAFGRPVRYRDNLSNQNSDRHSLDVFARYALDERKKPFPASSLGEKSHKDQPSPTESRARGLSTQNVNQVQHARFGALL